MRKSQSTGSAATGGVLGAPMENSTEPPTGWPSVEITRQLSTWVPDFSFCGLSMVTVWSLRRKEVSATDVPSGRTRVSTSGDTGSLKVSENCPGPCANTAPSTGSALISAACANARPGRPIATSSAKTARSPMTSRPARLSDMHIVLPKNAVLM